MSLPQLLLLATAVAVPAAAHEVGSWERRLELEIPDRHP